MPHIPIIVDSIEALEQIDEYHEQITENIANEMYEGKQLEDAQALLSSTETMLADHKTELDTVVGNMETLLGI